MDSICGCVVHCGICSNSMVALTPPSTTRAVSNAPLGAQGESHSKRQRAVNELLATEKNYVDDLLMVVKTYRQPLTTVLSDGDMHALFANWDELIDVGKQLYQQMESRQDELGRVLMSFESKLTQVFTRFCANQQRAVDLLMSKEETVICSA